MQIAQAPVRLATALTESGMGCCLDLGGSDDPSEIARLICRGLSAHRLVLLRHVPLSLRRFRELSAAVGTIVPIDDIDPGMDILVLDASEGSIVKGIGMLPLHSDGLLRGRKLNMLILYCPGDFSSDAGATIVCDQLAAFAEMPADLKEILRSRGLEYQAQESKYFTLEEFSRWRNIDAVEDIDGQEVLRLALPFEEGSPAAWRVKVPGCSEQESADLLARLAAFLTQRRFIYAHKWARGDLLVIDNLRTLHGRHAIDPANRRTIWRSQVN